MNYKHWTLVIASVIGLVLPARTASADAIAIYQVSIDTSALVGQGLFSLDLILTDGSTIGDSNTTVTLSNVNFGGGSASGFPFTFGGGSGDLDSGVTLSDSDGFFNEFLQDFLAGNTLSFTLGLSTAGVEVGQEGTPDLLTLGILASSGFPVPTQGLGDEFIRVSLNGNIDAPQGFASDPNRSDFNVPAPEITQVPEPASLMLVGTGIAGFVRRRRRQ